MQFLKRRRFGLRFRCTLASATLGETIFSLLGLGGFNICIYQYIQLYIYTISVNFEPFGH